MAKTFFVSESNCVLGETGDNVVARVTIAGQSALFTEEVCDRLAQETAILLGQWLSDHLNEGEKSQQ